jgi:hypothetical protein
MPQTEKKIMTMLADIDELPGIMGECIYIDKNGISFSNLPTWCPNTEMEKTGQLINELFTKNSVLNRRQNNIIITFESVLILAVRLNDYASLICLCLSSIDPDFFKTASQNIIEKLKREIPLITVAIQLKDTSTPEEIFAGEAQSNEKILDQENADSAKTASPEEKSSDLSDRVLLPVERALTKVIGPASEILLADTLKIWKENGVPSDSRINELINLLCQKIGSGQQEDKFREILQRLMPGHDTSVPEIKRIEKALARIMGPASSVVIEEILKKWQPDNLSSGDQQKELVNLLCIEIDDREKEEKFRSMVISALA